mgnify:CR=1 FL=1|tara:strand:+ start:122 stop:1003 length:882 start_codon:yes stop_codon:yes gene_type:complete
MNNMMPPLQANANDLAKYGRYGDSMLVHMNPAEVQGIAALSPTGQLTTNPVTGQPEAFLPFLAPFIAKLLPAALTKVGLGGLGAAAAAAPGLTTAATSGLITGIAEGDLEKGILAGLTSFGMGKALGAASDAVNLEPEIGKVAAAESGLADATKTLGTQAQSPGLMMANITPEQAAEVTARNTLASAQSKLDTARLGVSPTKQIGSVFTREGAEAGLEAFMKPEAILPTAIGAGNLAQMEAMEIQNALGKEQEAKRKRRREMDRGVLSGAAQFAQPNNPFAGVFNKPGLSAFS